MISRRLLRTKVLHVLYAHFRNEGNSIQQTEKELVYSIEKAYDLYHFLLSLIVEVADYAQDRIDLAKNKYRPSEADLNPNLRFVQNPVIRLLRENNNLTRHLERSKLHWKNDADLIQNFYQLMLESPDFTEYMNLETTTFEQDVKAIVKFYNKEIMHSEDLYLMLEEHSIFWNDDIEYVINMIAKTIKRMTNDDSPDQPLMPLFRDEEDREFVIKLLRKSLLMSSELDQLISDNTQNWDLERIVFMDRLLIRLAMVEILEFSSIPIKVTINEYLEISKMYSSEKSNVFINGVLDKLILKFRAEDRINKQGRGLIGEMV